MQHTITKDQLDHNYYITPNTLVQFDVSCYFILIVILKYIDLSLSLTCNLTGKDFQYSEIILPTMLALCLMLSGTYYAQNYASIIGWYLLFVLE